MAAHNKRFNIRPVDVSAALARPPVTRATMPAVASKVLGERRRVISTDGGQIIWHDWQTHERLRLDRTIAAKVAQDKQFVSQFQKPKPRK